MAETDAQIRISAIGGDEAAAALNKPLKAMENIGATHNDLVDKFSHRFEHIGLQVFAGEALRASGVGMETRAVISTLQLGLTSLGGAFGAAAMPILLVVSALTAAYGIFEKINHKTSESADNLKKLTDEQQKNRTSLESDIEKLQKYKDILGGLPPTIEALLQAKIRMKEFDDKEEILSLQKQITTTQQLIDQEKKHAEELQKQSGFAETLTTKHIALIASHQGLSVAAGAVAMKFKDYGKAITENNTSLEKHLFELAEAKARLDAAKKGTADWEDALKKLADAREKASKDNIEAINKEANAETEKFQHWAELHAKQLKQDEEMNKQFVEHAKSAIDKINTEQSMAFSKMIVEGQSFAQATAHIWRDLAEQVIAQIEAMLVKYALLSAFTGGSMVTTGMAGKMLGFAEGGSVLIDKPTMFLAGEAGQPEIATFTPLSKLGSGGGQSSTGGSSSSVQIGTVQTNVYGLTNPDAIADKVGLKIAERIRGQGEINFTRPS